MDRQQQEKARRVWQRVNGQATPMPAQRQENNAINEELEVAALLNQLAQGLNADQKQLLRPAQTRQQECVTLLRGIQAMQSQQTAPRVQKRQEKQPAKQLIYLCWGKNQGLIGRYSQQTGSEQWGYVYSCLLEQKKEQNVVLLKILGTM